MNTYETTCESLKSSSPSLKNRIVMSSSPSLMMMMYCYPYYRGCGRIFLTFFSLLGLAGGTIIKCPLAPGVMGAPEEVGLRWAPNIDAMKRTIESNIILFTSFLLGGIKLPLFLGFNHGSATTSPPRLSPTTIFGWTHASALAFATPLSLGLCSTTISLDQFLSLVKIVNERLI